MASDTIIEQWLKGCQKGCKRHGFPCFTCARAAFEGSNKDIFETYWKKKKCENCDFHGFPCLNCAAFVFKGMLGPGYSERQPTLLPKSKTKKYGNDPRVYSNMLRHPLTKSEACVKVKNLYEWENEFRRDEN